MNWNWKENNKQKHQFRSYFCSHCKQRKSCHTISQKYCCSCAYQIERERGEEYSDYQLVFQQKEQERKDRIQHLQLLRNYRGCKNCGSLDIDAYNLYENSQLICQSCRMKKEGGASGSVNFLERQKWYKRYWKIDLMEWLENFSQLPVNAECAREWVKDKEHLKSCKCLEIEAQKLYLLFTNSLKKYEEKLAKCFCKTSEKVRVDSDYYNWCERCQEPISVASKKRVIKNRNDPRFWGLNIREKVLCLGCLGKFWEKMPVSKKYTFNKYLKRGYV